MLAGQRRPDRGAVTVGEHPWRGTRKDLRLRKVRVLPELPLDNAGAAKRSVADNLAAPAFDRPPLSRLGLVSKQARRRHAADVIAAFNVKPPRPEAALGTLSGGNVQRAVLGRALHDACDVLVVANPCFGLDFEATAEIHRRLRSARDQGTAVLLVSEDLDEILHLADRLAVMFEGQIVHETTPATTDRATLGRFMAGDS